MADSLPSLSELGKYRKKIGKWPLLFFTLAITTATFTSNLKTDEEITSLLNFTAGCLFALGLLKIISAFFTHRPARGLIDGLGAGLVAGIIGGFFGYGFHNVFELPGFTPLSYVEPRYYRIGLCVLFATPVGGIMGMLCDLAHPDRAIPWRKYIGAMILAITILLCVTGYGVHFTYPLWKGLESWFRISNFSLKCFFCRSLSSSQPVSTGPSDVLQRVCQFC
jgi:hypothetical protein